MIRYKSKFKKRSANACEVKVRKRLKNADEEHETASAQTDWDSDVEVTSWTGGEALKNDLIVSDESDSDVDYSHPQIRNVFTS